MKTIQLPAGRQVLEEAIYLESGTVLEGHPDGSTVLSGGLDLKHWVRKGRFLTAAVPPGIMPRMLMINGRICPRSCYPCDGSRLCTLDHCGLRWMNSVNGGWDRKPTAEELHFMTVDPEKIPDFEIRNAEVTMFHTWDESTVRVKKFDRVSGRIDFLDEAGHPSGAFGRNEFVIWNIAQGMEKPGCWMHDRVNSEIIYYPAAGEKIESAAVSVLNGIIIVNGKSDVIIRNLTLELGNYSGPNAGLRAVNPEGAVEISDSENVVVENIRLRNCAGNGVRTRRCRGISIRNCHIDGMGAGGISTLESMPSVISENTVEGIGRLCYSAPGITAGGKSTLVYVLDGSVPETGKALVRNNVIRDCSYCGIVCCGPGHEIDGNDIADVMRVLRDGAAIYVSRGDKVLIHHNYIHDVKNYEMSALYLDELSDGCRETGNVIAGCRRPFVNHLARNCRIEGNTVFSHSGVIEVRLTYCENYNVTDNTFVGTGEVMVKTLFNRNRFAKNHFLGIKNIRILKKDWGYR